MSRKLGACRIIDKVAMLSRANMNKNSLSITIATYIQLLEINYFECGYKTCSKCQQPHGKKTNKCPVVAYLNRKRSHYLKRIVG